MILQKNGNAMPSVAESLIKRLPEEGDPQRSRDETIAKGVLLVAYAGTWYCCIVSSPADFFIASRGAPVSGGADTVGA